MAINLIVIRLNTRGVGWNEPAADTAIFHTNSKSKSGCFKDNCRNDSKHTLSLFFAWNQVALIGLLRNRLKWRFQVGTRGTHGRRRAETRSSCNAETPVARANRPLVDLLVSLTSQIQLLCKVLVFFSPINPCLNDKRASAATGGSLETHIFFVVNAHKKD